jgi:antirestriction protein ArdC
MPRFDAFLDAYGYYSVLAHEATHWTGAMDRLHRELDSRFGSSAYAAEELIAELGAAFLCSTLRISNTPGADHAAYIKPWLELLRKDKRRIFTAAAKALDAVEWMQGRQVESSGQMAEAAN